MTIAKLIIEFAKEGERDPVRLRERLLKTLRPYVSRYNAP